MKPAELDEKLRNYRVVKARYAYLQHQLESLERYMAICRGTMISDQISMSQAITGMPHGSGVGDPTGRLAMDIASGKVSVFVKQIEEETKVAREKLDETKEELRVVEIVLEAMSEREKEIVMMKAVDDMSWSEITQEMNEKHQGSYGKRSLQRLYDRAMEKAYKTVA